MEVEAKLAADGSYDLEAGGKVFTLTRDMLEIERYVARICDDILWQDVCCVECFAGGFDVL